MPREDLMGGRILCLAPGGPPSEPAPHFKLTYGLHKRLAYLRSSNVTLPEREGYA